MGSPTWDARLHSLLTLPFPHSPFPVLFDVVETDSERCHDRSLANFLPDWHSIRRMELSSLAGAIALSMLVYKLFECTRVNAVLTTANRNYEIENGRLRTSINSSRGAVVNGKAVSQTISALEASLEESIRRLSKADDEVAVLNKRLAVLAQNEKVLRREKDQAHLDAKRALASAEAAGRAGKDLAIVEKERDEVFKRVEAATGEVAALEAKLAEAEGRRAEVEASFSDVSDLKASLEAKVGDMQAKLDGKCGELEALSAERDAAVGELEALWGQVAELQSEKASMVGELQAKLDGKCGELEALSGQVAELRSEKASLVATHRTELEALSQELSELRAEKKAMNSTEQQTDSTVSKLEAKIAELDRRLVEADASYSNAAAERAHAKAELADVEARSAKKIAQLEAEVAALTANSAGSAAAGKTDDNLDEELNTKIDELNARVANLESELTESQLSSTMLKEEKVAAERKVEQLKGLNETLLTRLQQLRGSS